MSENVQSSYKYKPNLIEWRRSKVLERLAQGATQSQIAQELQLHPSTISLDCQFLKEEAQKALETHIQTTIPFRYTQYIEGMRQILHMTHSIINKENLDDKTRLQCLTLLSSVYRYISEMTADGAVVEQAIKKVKQIQSQQFRTKVESYEQRAVELLKEEQTKAEENQQEDQEEDLEEDEE